MQSTYEMQKSLGYKLHRSWVLKSDYKCTLAVTINAQARMKQFLNQSGHGHRASKVAS